MATELIANGVLSVVIAALGPKAGDGSGPGTPEPGMEQHLPSMEELYPPPFWRIGDGSVFELNRLGLVRIIATVMVVLLVYLGARRMRLVPGRGQSTLELLMGFIHKQIAEAGMSPALARKYLPFIATLFFGILGMNLTGIIPGLNIASTALVTVPLILALSAWVAFVVRGIKAHGVGHYFADALFPKGAPKFMLVLLTPIEFLSTFILRPATLTIRLMANMIAGHFLLAAFFGMTAYYFLDAGSAIMKGAGVVTFIAAIIFTLFEVFVAALQAFIFSLLTSVYIGLAAEGH
ncbi:MAG: F0F1 ATP synthase subunit A [Micrococcales bacterium]|nr:F0F1 ATP synthase subunit A [Micrococcales bacterium]